MTAYSHNRCCSGLLGGGKCLCLFGVQWFSLPKKSEVTAYFKELLITYNFLKQLMIWPKHRIFYMCFFGLRNIKRVSFESSLVSLSCVFYNTWDTRVSFWKDKWCEVDSCCILSINASAIKQDSAKTRLPLCLLCPSHCFYPPVFE